LLPEPGGELLALRYDLTVPFARYLAQNKINSMKRYQIAKVYRRENPSANQGRYREFYQCDFDIAGQYDEMLPDSECMRILYEILHELEIKNFVIKVNHRALLNGIFKVCGVPDELFKPICSAIDKLDKMSWTDVRREMVVDKKLAEEVADKIQPYVKLRGQESLLDTLLEGELSTIPEAKAAIESLKLFYKYCSLLKIDHTISFDLSLARGLDYYNGIIFEVTLTENKTEIGSIAAGGRYDSLVGSLSDHKNFNVPCVGVSVGMERIFTIIEKQATTEGKKFHPTQVYVCSVGPNMTEERLKLIADLWSAGVRAEHSFKGNPKLLAQFKYCEDRAIPLCVIIGQNEVEAGIVKLRELALRKEDEVSREQLVEELQKRLTLL
jgi:histidyl-tRNA synthetase